MSLQHKQLGEKNNAGYTILFAVLVSTVLLSVGVFILNVSKKEVILSAIGRESIIAFYAADGGLECAHYWNAQADSPLGVKSNGDPTVGNIFCGGPVPITPSVIAPTQQIPSSIADFSIDIPVNGTSPGFCAQVKVIKLYDYAEGAIATESSPAGDASYRLIKTTIDSRGYNTCDTTSSRRVERGLREVIE